MTNRTFMTKTFADKTSAFLKSSRMVGSAWLTGWLILSYLLIEMGKSCDEQDKKSQALEQKLKTAQGDR